ncbi:glycoside hydrolase [Flavobacteriaceae bacterium]|nr:glycoside hydrolase [Flavobacteriaceae bacterium]
MKNKSTRNISFMVAILLFNNLKGQSFGKQGFNLPIVDLDSEVGMQTIIDKEKGQYLGHPTTLLLEDDKTIIAVYPKGHGKGAIVMKKSFDGGKTWSGRLPTQKSWDTSKEVPTMYSVNDANDKSRIIIFSGAQDHDVKYIRMSFSEDNGNTWSELKSIGNYHGIVAMSDVIPLKEKGHYMATFHIRGPKEDDTMILYQVYSEDGGLTWGDPQKVYEDSKVHLCEAGLVYSPDGSEIAMLLRENTRNYNSQIMFSKDEGKTWTAPKPMPGALCGDRHQAVYLEDGRLLIQFRDKTPKNRPGNSFSPTEGDWVGWIGTYEDLKEGNEGAYRVRFKDNKKGWDTTYPAAELLPDGSLVCTTYGHWEKGESPYILSFKFHIKTLDEKAKKIKKFGQTTIHNEMGKNMFIFNPDNSKMIQKKIED